MIAFILLILLCLLFLYFKNKKRKRNIDISTVNSSNDKVYEINDSENFEVGESDSLAAKSKTIFKTYIRKTYIKGIFVGKFNGKNNSIHTTNHTNWYDIKNLESKISVNENDIVKFNDIRFQEVEKLLNHKNELKFNYPNLVETEIIKTDSSKLYLLNYIDKQLTNIEFYHQVTERDDIYFTIKGDFLGYIEHPEEVEEEVEPVGEEGIPGGPVPVPPATPASQAPPIPPALPIPPENEKIGWATIFGGIIFLIMGLFTILQFGAFLYLGWPFILLFIGIGLINLIIHFIFNKLRWLGKFLIWALIISLFGLLLNSLINFQNIKPESDSYIPENDKIEKNDPEIVPILDTTNLKNDTTDFLIKNTRVWKDYDGNSYKGVFKIYKSAFIKSEHNRNNIPNVYSYNNMVNQLYKMDSSDDGMKFIYEMFDSIQNRKHLNDKKFAEMIVTCVQDIPYTLILPEECNPTGYNDQFIYDYLSSGGICAPNVKFGIYSPIEFLANLKGDCDTRTLLLFTILKHYNYNVVILGSEQYGHSILGVNLTYTGLNKIYNNRKYIVWETTAPGIKPGILPREISNMNNWEINLK